MSDNQNLGERKPSWTHDELMEKYDQLYALYEAQQSLKKDLAQVQEAKYDCEQKMNELQRKINDQQSQIQERDAVLQGLFEQNDKTAELKCRERKLNEENQKLNEEVQLLKKFVADVETKNKELQSQTTQTSSMPQQQMHGNGAETHPPACSDHDAFQDSVQVRDQDDMSIQAEASPDSAPDEPGSSGNVNVQGGCPHEDSGVQKSDGSEDQCNRSDHKRLLADLDIVHADLERSEYMVNRQRNDYIQDHLIIDDLRDTVHEKDQRISRQRKKIRELENENKDLKRHNSRLTEEREIQEVRIASATEHTENLSRQVRSLGNQGSSEDARRSCEALREEAAQLRKEIEDLRKQREQERTVKDCLSCRRLSSEGLQYKKKLEDCLNYREEEGRGDERDRDVGDDEEQEKDDEVVAAGSEGEDDQKLSGALENLDLYSKD